MIVFKYSLAGLSVAFAVASIAITTVTLLTDDSYDFSLLVLPGTALLGIFSLIFHLKTLKLYRSKRISDVPNLDETFISREPSTTKISRHLWVFTSILGLASLGMGIYLTSIFLDSVSHFNLMEGLKRSAVLFLLLFHGFGTFIDLRTSSVRMRQKE